jgi:hypothetical protein
MISNVFEVASLLELLELLALLLLENYKRGRRRRALANEKLLDHFT